MLPTALTSPVDTLDSSDPGDMVIKKFRYQFGYGVILLAGMVEGKLRHKAIWCEQYEDFLGEDSDGTFVAYQIKTRRSEIGEWDTNDEAFIKSVGRFIDLQKKFPGKISAFKFVSNTEYSTSSAKGSEMYSPIKLLNVTRTLSSENDITGEVKKGFYKLVSAVGSTPGELFSVLRCMNVVRGP
ncbi:MAG: hypothetical protein JWO08_2711, partial [Verrucomicrobiaceae bacterium]|nr:hypothetical protein [Verrucomicrobiaceae bacterium]